VTYVVRRGKDALAVVVVVEAVLEAKGDAPRLLPVNVCPRKLPNYATKPPRVSEQQQSAQPEKAIWNVKIAIAMRSAAALRLKVEMCG
jgi:hypothetical protein